MEAAEGVRVDMEVGLAESVALAVQGEDVVASVVREGGEAMAPEEKALADRAQGVAVCVEVAAMDWAVMATVRVAAVVWAVELMERVRMVGEVHSG